MSSSEPWMDMSWGAHGPCYQVQSTPYTRDQAKNFLGQTLDALTFIHEKLGIIHCDIKPDNICVSKRYTDGTMDFMLIDFGIATQRSRGGGAYECIASGGGGTPGYVAPEVYAGSFGAGCDVWSLGVTAYELMRGLGPAELLRYYPQGYSQRDEVRAAMVKDQAGMGESSKKDLYRVIIGYMLDPDTRRRPTARECHARLGCEGSLETDRLQYIGPATEQKPAAGGQRKEKREKVVVKRKKK